MVRALIRARTTNKQSSTLDLRAWKPPQMIVSRKSIPNLFLRLSLLAFCFLYGCSSKVEHVEYEYVPIPKDQLQREWLIKEREIRLNKI